MTNCTLISHERTSVHFLVLPDSLSSITEITEYLNFSQSRPWLNLNTEVTKNIVPLVLIIGPNSFLRNTFHYISAVRGRSKCELVHSWTVLFPYVSVPVSCFRKDFHPPLLPSFFFTVTTKNSRQKNSIVPLCYSSSYFPLCLSFLISLCLCVFDSVSFFLFLSFCLSLSLREGAWWRRI